MKPGIKESLQRVFRGFSREQAAEHAGHRQVSPELFLCKPDFDFVERSLPRLRGWLFPEAAYMTCHLLRQQTAWGIRGAGVEIGIYEGRYLALIHRLLTERSDATIGIDTFQFISEKEVRGALRTVLGPEASALVFQKRNSASIRPEELCDWAKGRPAVISIDGDHGATAVTRDLTLAEDVLREGGLVVVDDFLNHFAVGVTEGVYAYLFEKKIKLVPCVFIGQKLFFCLPGDANRYRTAAFRFGQYGSIKSCVDFRDYLRRDISYVEPRIAGHKVVMFVSPRCDAACVAS